MDRVSLQLSFMRKIALPALLGLLFSIAYTQSPLYTSNQNQYFLHGLAQAGLGYLEQDWLANTLDPTPVFSLLVEWTYRLFHQPVIFYCYSAVLLGIYLLAMVGIADELFQVRKSTARWLTFLALFFLIHSAALRFFFSRALGDNWTYLLEDGVADQRLLGPVLQPSTFGVLLVVSIVLYLRRKSVLAILAAILAATIHPTYLLSAAALTLAYLLGAFQASAEQSLTGRLKRPFLFALLALLAVSPILFYVYFSFGNASPETSNQAQAILVNFRIPFHALPARWLDLTAMFKILLIASALIILRRTVIFPVLAIPALIATVLTLIQIFTGSNFLALLFPWRVTTFLVPLSTTLLLAAGVKRWFDRRNECETTGLPRIRAASYTLIGLVVLVGAIRLVLDFQRQASAPDRSVMAFAADQAASEQIYLVPLDMQDFRLVSGVPVYVEFKSIPYRDADVLEWERRIQLTDLFYKKGDCGSLDKLAAKGINHVIAPPKLYDWKCEGWEALYQDSNYAIYKIR
ncbi:MAG: hypothetical protein MUE67_06945 [Anaerolineales bacterium]|jgi:hypothetical protein|nr:hypothetical protein [Anaerolineales bacterium]